jgi:hypothetical protein
VVVIKKECRKIKGRNIRSDYGQISALTGRKTANDKRENVTLTMRKAPASTQSCPTFTTLIP